MQSLEALAIYCICFFSCPAFFHPNVLHIQEFSHPFMLSVLTLARPSCCRFSPITIFLSCYFPFLALSFAGFFPSCPPAQILLAPAFPPFCFGLPLPAFSCTGFSRCVFFMFQFFKGECQCFRYLIGGLQISTSQPLDRKIVF